jgi:DNA-binding transcriptional regulator GbsR (MarR family)
MEIGKWCREKEIEGGKLNESRKMKYFGSYKQPQIVLANMYMKAKNGKADITVGEISVETGVPYSTVRSMLDSFAEFGLVRRVESKGRAHVFRASVFEMERLIKKLASDK